MGYLPACRYLKWWEVTAKLLALQLESRGRGNMNEAYRSNVMGVQLPVQVTIARKTVPLREIIQLIPGAMILFNQQCDEPLTLDIGNQTIGRGIAVKVGDKFGLKISEIGKC